MKNSGILLLLCLFAVAASAMLTCDAPLQLYHGSNTEFYPGTQWQVSNGVLAFQDDGNLVVYNKTGSIIWHANTANKGVRAKFQNDGNFVIYKNGGKPVYATDTPNKVGRILVFQEDGNLVMYGKPDSLVVWSSINAPKCWKKPC